MISLHCESLYSYRLLGVHLGATHSMGGSLCSTGLSFGRLLCVVVGTVALLGSALALQLIVHVLLCLSMDKNRSSSHGQRIIPCSWLRPGNMR